MTVRSAAAIVLVGGQSSRMGTDKASLIVDGMSMLDRVLVALASAGISSIAVVGGDDIADVIPHAGPLAGIVAGWQHLRGDGDPDPVVVLSCDLPALTPEVIVDLIAAAGVHRHGALAHDGVRPQPLVAAYRPAALDEFGTAFENGVRSPRRCFDGWDLGTVAVQADLVADADTPQDLRGFDVEWPR